LLFAAAGLPSALLPTLAEGGMLALRLADGSRLPSPGTSWRLTPEWMGRDGPPYLFEPSCEWHTLTPFVTPQWTRRNSALRGGREVAAQVRRELALRRLPPAEQLTVEPGRGSAASWIGPAGFGRSGSGRCPPTDAEAAHVSIRFAEPVAGPLALGFGAHFGLGLFGRMVPRRSWAPMHTRPPAFCDHPPQRPEYHPVAFPHSDEEQKS
jgi:CRISPR-associated protein Csb2